MPTRRGVLEALKSLHPKAIEDCRPGEARTQPTPADAVKKLMKERGISMPASVEAIRAEDITYSGANGAVPARVGNSPHAFVELGDEPSHIIALFFRSSKGCRTHKSQSAKSANAIPPAGWQSGCVSVGA
jgi:hypothetical protein